MVLRNNKTILLKLLIISFFLTVTQVVFPQLNTSLYFTEKYSINPAFAGEKSFPHLNTFYKTGKYHSGQRFEAVYFGASANVYKHTSVGGRFFQTSDSINRTLNVFLDYAYLLEIDKKNTFRFGFSTSFEKSSLKPGNITDSIVNGSNSMVNDNASIGISAGMAYKFKNFEFSASIPDILKLKDGEDFWINTLLLYEIRSKKQDIVITPGAFIYHNPIQGFFYDIGVTTKLNNALSFGILYKSYGSVTASVGVRYSNRLAISYANEQGLIDKHDIPKQTHEIALSYTFTKKGRKNKKNTFFQLFSKEKKAESISLSGSSRNNNQPEKDTISVVESEQKKPSKEKKKIVIVEIGKGIFMVKVKMPNGEYQSLNNQLAISGESASTEDSILRSNLLEYIDNMKKENNYKLVEIGDGIFVLKSGDGTIVSKPDLTSTKLDSLIINSGLFEQYKSIEDIGSLDSDTSHTYSLQLFINEDNSELLINQLVSENLLAKKDERGNNVFYWGKFNTIGAALVSKKELDKLENLETKLVKIENFE